MLNADGLAILSNLEEVEALRREREATPGLGLAVLEVKRFQHRRFERGYADLLSRPDCRSAAVFFLEELYGPHDFSARDAQFGRIVPALVRLFPAEIVGTVRQLSELHALSERLDTAMAKVLMPMPPEVPESYRSAWQRVGEPDLRQHQIDLMMSIGRALVRYTRNPMLRAGLRMMRGPAELAGLSALQRFLERGFDTFRALPDPNAFLGTIANREALVARWLFTEPQAQPAPPGFE